ncbi:MAG: methyltransferase domain-containing protein [Candidatus Competibacteraceae bacterium]|nr:methyltransferase domain-containing protein [Candidatus Competibacteraceae bacterium]
MSVLCDRTDGRLFRRRHDQAAQSICAEAEQAFSEEAIHCVVTWSGTRLSIRAAAAVARAQGIPVVTLESPYFPHLPEAPEQEVSSSLHKLTFRTLIWDTLQAPQCGPSQLTRDWRKAAVHPGLSKFLDALRETRTSKFSQEDIRSKMKAHLRTEEPLEVSLFKPPATKALLVLGQTDHDSSMCYGEHSVRSWRELGVALARRLPKGWILWFKGHPLEVKFSREIDRFAQELHDINPHCKLLNPSMDVHACYAACDAVACINSTATIEAALYELPVLNLGVGSFTHIGMSTAIKDLDTLEATIAGLPARMSSQQIAIRDQFLSYVLYDYLIPLGSPRKMLSRLRQAITEAQLSTPVADDPIVVHGLGERQVRVQVLAETNTNIDEFMRQGEGDRPWQVFELTQSQDVRQWVANPREIALLQPMLEDLGKRLRALNRPVSVLDVGCYGGYVYDYLVQEFFPEPGMLTYTGVDVQERAVVAAARIHEHCPNARFQCADLFNLGADFAPESFDAVVCYRVMIHLPDFERAVRNLCQTAISFVHTALWVDSEPRCRRCLETDLLTGQKVTYYHRWVTEEQLEASALDTKTSMELIKTSDDTRKYAIVVFCKS